MEKLLDRLSRRGVLTITADDGTFQVRIKIRRHPRTIDVADLFEWCHLGASDWSGEGTDLAELLAACEGQSRPAFHDVDGLVVSIEQRRASRTYGPPLPTFIPVRGGWVPGHGRWLRVGDHAREYLAGHLWNVARAREDAARFAHLRKASAS